jgi:hypothetical protein
MTKAIVVALIAGLTGGCTYGMSTGKLRLTNSPRGVETRITSTGVEFAGELIEIRESALVLLSQRVVTPVKGGVTATPERRLRLIPYTAVLNSQFEQLSGRLRIVGGRAPTGEGREDLRLVSRFPQGLSPEVLLQLLKEHGQTELAGIQP